MQPGVLAGRSALVTGGSKGIGLAVANALRDAGARVLVVARSEQALRATGHAYAVADVTRDDDVRRVLDAVPDIVVHSAGAFQLAALHETSIDLFDQMLGVNLRGAFLLIHHALPAMLARGTGHIISIGSIAGRQAFAANGAYSASKFGLRGLHAVLNVELRGTGVRATLVEPAATDTPLWGAIDRGVFKDLPPAEAMLSPEAVARAVLYAVSQPESVAVPNLLVERS